MCSHVIYKQYLLAVSEIVSFAMLKNYEYMCMKYCLAVTEYFNRAKF